jgi:beta-phosphoglucomutase-like phosphatase (HAD superfamily)
MEACALSNVDGFRKCKTKLQVIRHKVVGFDVQGMCACMQEMVADLRKQGLKTVIITNGHPEIQRRKLQRIGADDLFDAFIVGGEEIEAGGNEKPAASIFLKACHLAGCLPSEVSVAC